jgi:hypothetical protein
MVKAVFEKQPGRVGFLRLTKGLVLRFTTAFDVDSRLGVVKLTQPLTSTVAFVALAESNALPDWQLSTATTQTCTPIMDPARTITPPGVLSSVRQTLPKQFVTTDPTTKAML